MSHDSYTNFDTKIVTRSLRHAQQQSVESLARHYDTKVSRIASDNANMISRVMCRIPICMGKLPRKLHLITVLGPGLGMAGRLLGAPLLEAS